SPGRLPASRSACRTQFRSVSPEQPIFSAIDWMAAHCEEYSLSCSNTIRTARSRTSGEYFFALVMTPISQRLEPPANPGRFTSAEGREVATTGCRKVLTTFSSHIIHGQAPAPGTALHLEQSSCPMSLFTRKEVMV